MSTHYSGMWDNLTGNLFKGGGANQGANQWSPTGSGLQLWQDREQTAAQSLASQVFQGSPIRGAIAQGRVSSSQPQQHPMPSVSTSAQLTPSPTTLNQTVSKLAANEALPAHPEVVIAVLPAILKNVVYEGAPPLQAVEALKTQAAIAYTQCKKQMKSASSRDQGLLKKIMYPAQLTSQSPFFRKMRDGLVRLRLLQERILILNKQSQILAIQNDADTQLKTLSTMNDLMTEMAILEGELFASISSEFSAGLDDPSLLNCLVEGAKAEGALSFEANFGSSPKSSAQLIAEGQKPPEEAVQDAEAAEIILQAAQQGVGDEEPDIAPTKPSKGSGVLQLGGKNLLTPENILLGGLAVGGIYLLFFRGK